jgi:hypothetical protein
LAWLVLLAFAEVAGAFENNEFGLRATIPGSYPECVANTQGHIHGVGTVLLGRDCENAGRQPAFNVWANYNTTDHPNALEVLRGNECTGSRLRWADDEWRGAISGLRTAVCRFDGPGDAIELRLAAQAWKWPGDAHPYINYTANFSSTKSRVDQDLQVFKRFVASIRIVKPDSLGAESPKPRA